MKGRIVLPTNYTDADIVAAVEGLLQGKLNIKVKARVMEPADLPTAYEEIEHGRTGGMGYSVLRNVNTGEELLHLTTLGYFTIIVD